MAGKLPTIDQLFRSRPFTPNAKRRRNIRRHIKRHGLTGIIAPDYRPYRWIIVDEHNKATKPAAKRAKGGKRVR